MFIGWRLNPRDDIWAHIGDVAVGLGIGGLTAVFGAWFARGGVEFIPWSRVLGRKGIRLAISAGLGARGRPGIGDKQERNGLLEHNLLLFVHLCAGKINAGNLRESH